MIKNLSEVRTITTKQLLSALEDQLLVIHGGGGDLARLKLYRALAKLKSQGKIPKNLRILVIDKEPLTTGSFRGDLRPDLLDQWLTEEEVEAELCRVHYLQANLKDPSAYALIKQQIEALKEEYQLKRCVHYLAVWPDLFPIIIENLGKSGLLKEGFKVAIEKPCAEDLKSSQALLALLKKYCKDEQIFIIDHYLTKKQVQNIVCTRFANAVYEPIWNHRDIRSIKIKAIESLTCKGRYDFPGLIKDMAGHLVQILALLTMENPNSLDAEAISQEKVKVLKNTEIDLKSTIFGQF
jgi:glucose-6-phosphate 1-dehydrogenase